ARINVTAQSAGTGGGPFATGGQIPADLAGRIKVIDGVRTAYPTITLQAEDSEVASFGPPSLIYAYRPSDLPSDVRTLELRSGKRFSESERGKVIIGSSVVREKNVKLGDSVSVR